MRTHLRKTGNSYGIIVPAHIRRMLWLGTRSILQLSTDGRRIIIEPTGELLDEDELRRARQLLSAETGRPEPKVAELSRDQLQKQCAAVWEDLYKRYDVGQKEVEALWHEPTTRFWRVGSWLERKDCALNANADELDSIRRFRLCRDRLRAGDKWPKALAAALAMFPKRALDAVAQVSARPSSAQPSSVQPSSVQPSSVQPSSVQPSSVQPSSVQPSSVQPSSVQRASAQLSSARPSS